MLESKIKILFLATGWGDHGGRERLDEEAREIVRKIRLGAHRDRFEFASEWAVKIGVPGFQAYSSEIDFPHGALLARINTGDWRLIGSEASFQASESGLLELLVNDNDARNNDGQFSVRINVSRMRKNGR